MLSHTLESWEIPNKHGILTFWGQFQGPQSDMYILKQNDWLKSMKKSSNVSILLKFLTGHINQITFLFFSKGH